MKYFEGCVEAPLQICLQTFIFIAGQMPGKNDNSAELYFILSNYIDYLLDYAYIADEPGGDPSSTNTAQNCNRHSLSTFVNVSNVPTAPFSMVVTSNTQPPLSNNLEPEPYATTDILRAEKEKLQQHHYAVNTFALFYCLA